MSNTPSDEQRLALFIDFENIAIGVRDAHYRKFDINLVLERLLDKGKLLVKRAYADWSRYSDYKRSFHEAAVELIEVPQKFVGGKNSADIRLVVDAMDMSFQKEHINCFVVASGDSDFSPLVSKLKENDKYVIGLGVKNSTSDLLIENCDEFIFYEDLVRVQERPLPQIPNVPEKLQECFGILADSIIALQRENKEILWGSMVKETMKRKKPSFNETYYGFRTFSHLLEDAQRRGIVTLRRDQRSGSYIVEDLVLSASASGAARTSEVASASGARSAETAPQASAAGAEEASSGNRPSRRRRGRRRPRVALGSQPSTGAQVTAADEALDGDEADDLDDAAEGAEDVTAAGDERDARGSQTDAASPAETDASNAVPPPNPSRPAFSLFSWLRRDPEPEPEDDTRPKDSE